MEKKRLLEHQFNLVGQCNYENIMAAAAIGTAMGVPMETIRQTAYNFKAVEHRIEYTATKKQVRYYNDSKGTNPDAAIQGIRAMTTPTCLVGGGYDKGSTYDEWIEAFGSTIKYLVLIGQTSKAIADCCEKHGFTNYEFATSMEEAVEKCASHAKPGEAVLLSPACASWGMFDNYEQRGRIFKELVRKLDHMRRWRKAHPQPPTFWIRKLLGEFLTNRSHVTGPQRRSLVAAGAIDSEGQPTGAYEPAFADWFELQGEREEEARIGLAS